MDVLGQSSREGLEEKKKKLKVTKYTHTHTHCILLPTPSSGMHLMLEWHRIDPVRKGLEDGERKEKRK